LERLNNRTTKEHKVTKMYEWHDGATGVKDTEVAGYSDAEQEIREHSL
jgi:hypothetical protein